MTLTLDEVRKTKFHMARRTGYEVSEVDLFVDRVEASFAQLTEENDALKQQVEALKQSQTQSRQRGNRQEPSNEELARQRRQAEQRQPEPPKPQPAVQQPPAGEPQRLVVATSAEASTAVVRLVQMATEQSEQLVSEATEEARRKVEEATSKAHEITTDAQTKSERIGSEARVNAERMTSEAKSRAADIDRQAGERRAELFSQLETERDLLQEAVGQLRAFEANYRQTFTSHLKQQLQGIDKIVLEPTAKPELADASRRDNSNKSQGQRAAQSSSDTPRLDALLGDNQRNG